MKRIKLVKKNQNPLFQKWLQEWQQQAEATGKEELARCFTKCLTSLKKHPLVLSSGKECLVLDNFGSKVCLMLDKRLEKHQKLEEQLKNVGSKEAEETPRAEEPQQPAYYYIQKGTPAYGMLIIIFKNSLKADYPGYMLKEDIAKQASEDNDSSVKGRAVGSTGNWCQMSKLIKDGLVSKTSSPAKFSLTPLGKNLASELYQKLVKSKPHIVGELNKDALVESSKNNSPTSSKLGDKFKQSIENRIKDDHIVLIDSDCDSNHGFEDFCRENEEPVINIRKSSSNFIFTEPYDAPSALDKSHGQINERTEETNNIVSGDKNSKKACDQNSKKTCDQNSKKACDQMPSDSFFLLPNNFDIILLVDTQETSGNKTKASDDATKSELLSLKVNFEVRSLSVGDFAWIAKCRFTGKELVLPFIVERKRMDDLSASIKDGRYKEQKHRLKLSGIQHITYLIEGYGKTLYASLPLESLLQAGTNSAVQDKFNVKYTHSHKDSMSYLSQKTKILNTVYEGKELWSCKKQGIEYPDSHILNDHVRLMEFSDFNKSSIKTKNFSVQEILIKQLMQVKGISSTRAVRIAQLYPTPILLREAFMREGENLLTDVKLESSKIGASISQALHMFYTAVDLQ